MTDKEKIREEVEKLKSNLIYGACSSQIAMETMCKEEAYNEVLAILDTMQEEPVGIWHDASKKSDNPEDVVIIDPSDNTGEVLTKCTGVNQGHIWAYTSELLNLDNSCNIGKNLQEPQVKESTKTQHVNDMCKEKGKSLTQESVSKVWHYQKKEPVNEIVDKSRPIIVVYGNNSLNAAGKFRYYEDNSDAIWLSNSYEKWAFVEDLINLTHSVTKVSWQEEPVSEGLEEASKEWLKPQLDKSYADYGETKMMELTNFDGYAMLDAIEFGAKWQITKLVEEAVKHEVKVDAGGYPYIPQMELYDYDKDIPLAKEGDKYNVVLIKED